MDRTQENHVRVALHVAVGGQQILLDGPLDDADEMIAFARRTKGENPELHGRIRVWKARPNRVAFQRQSGD
jgi:hypothetical protein